MGKRTSPDSDDESLVNAAVYPKKRARTDEHSGAGPSADQDGKTGTGKFDKGKGRARQSTEEASDDDDDMQVDGDYEKHEKPASEINDECIELQKSYSMENWIEDLTAKTLTTGGIAECGVIETVEMHQFMCHKHLTFTFGPQINFIIGHNGSGKSAVLSAITIALGGKTKSTGRGNGLKSFIREGQSSAEVTLTLKNQGDEAFRPQNYGKSIIITRRFTKAGSSSWKIQGHDKRVISTKKDELASICEHMGIQVDNPMNILTQDAARTFLSGSKPGEMYKLFLSGTQLARLYEEYETSVADVKTSNMLLQQKKEALPDLRASYNEARTRLAEAEEAEKQKQRLADLQNELAWSHVAAKELDVSIALEHIADSKAKVSRIQEDLKEAQEGLEKSTSNFAKYEQEVHDLGDVDELIAEKNTIKDKMADNRRTLEDLRGQIKEINTLMAGSTDNIQGYQAQIADETMRIAGDTAAKHEEKERKLQAAREAVEKAQKNVSSLEEKLHATTLEADKIKALGEPLDTTIHEIAHSIKNCEDTLKKVTQFERNELIAYGRDIPTVLKKILQTEWVGGTPIGPLGVHVKARDPKVWGELLRSQLGSCLKAFAVTDPRDSKRLKAILNESGNGDLVIFIFERDMFDFRRGEPPSHLLTVLRALEIDEPHVLRILINQAKIERILLAPNREDGQQLLETVAGGGSAWTLDYHNPRRFPEGGVATQPLRQGRPNDGTNLLLTGRDAKAEKVHHEAERAKLVQKLQTVTSQRDILKNQYTKQRQVADELKRQFKQATTEVLKAEQKLQDLQNELNDEVPLSITGLHDLIREAEAEKEQYKDQFTELEKQKQGIDDDQSRLLTRKNDIQKLVDEFDEVREAATTKVATAAQARLEAHNKVRHWEKKLDAVKAALAVAEDAAKVLQDELEDRTREAMKCCQRILKPHNIESIQKKIKSFEKALAERNRRNGATIEELTIERDKAETKLHTAKNDMKEIRTLNKNLGESLNERHSKWYRFRCLISHRCNIIFRYYLSRRGYYGEIEFDHEKGTLKLKVQTDDQTQTQGDREKDARLLSGGEKSFSTICLLLSMWECIGCPLRCLDEFDVFMDAINRLISIKTITDAASYSDNKQYILITPLLGNIPVDNPAVKVHRMLDPKRNQGALASS